MRHRYSPAFTIVELLVVIGVIGVLIGLLAPTLAGIRAESKSVACLNNLRQVQQAVEVYRQRNESVLPFAEPLPAATPDGAVGGLAVALDPILARASEQWQCPADSSDDLEQLGTSYAYVPGAWMLLLPPNPTLSPLENVRRAARQVTREYETGVLSHTPIIVDSEDRHVHGDRLPRNVVFLDGTTRMQKPADSVIDTAALPMQDS